jgi:nicotinamidase-related amidase
MNSALLLIDIQNDYFPNGRMPLERSTEASAKAQEALNAFRAKQQKAIVHVQHISTRPDATYFLPCTKGLEFHANVQPTKNETIIKKHYPNSFKDTTLLNHLTKNKINHLVICGMMTHLCVDATVRAAYDLGFSCTVLHDACASRNLEFNGTLIPAQSVQNAFMAALQPTYANVLSVREWLQTIGVSSNSSAVPA